MVRKLFAPIVLALLVVACNPPTPAAQLEISARTPAASATEVPVDANVTATFSQAVNPTTVTDESFTLTTGTGDALVEVPGAVSYDADSRVATFDPTDDLLPATVYTATVTTDVASTGGRSLARNSSWTFTTVVPTEGVTIMEGDQVLTMDDGPVQLTAMVFPADDTITWASGDDAVVTVDADGLLTVVGPGTTTVSATSDTDATRFDEISVTVAEPLVATLESDQVDDVANIYNLVAIPAPSLSSGGHGELTWEITSGALPAPFSVTPHEGASYEYPDSPYELTLDAATGVVSGSTGFPGVYEWTLTATDEAGQTASVDYTLVLDVSLEYVDSFDETLITSVDFPAADAPRVVVEGERVRVSGVRDTRDLDPAFLADFLFEINDEVNFDINEADGTITFTSGVSDTYPVIVTVTYSGDPDMADPTDTYAIELNALI